MKRILVAVDESEGSRRAVEFVERFFSGMDVAITAVNVTRTPVDVVVAPYEHGSAWQGQTPRGHGPGLRREAEAERVLTQQAPDDADLEVLFGKAVDAICQAAEHEDADVIVVGYNDKGFLERLLGGSVSEDLARSAPRPVLIVR